MESVIIIISSTQLCATPISINFFAGPSWGQSLTLLLFSVFRVPIEVTVQQQHSNRPIPRILVKCANYLILLGNSQKTKING